MSFRAFGYGVASVTFLFVMVMSPIPPLISFSLGVGFFAVMVLVVDEERKAALEKDQQWPLR